MVGGDGSISADFVFAHVHQSGAHMAANAPHVTALTLSAPKDLRARGSDEQSEITNVGERPARHGVNPSREKSYSAIVPAPPTMPTRPQIRPKMGPPKSDCPPC